MAPSGLNFKPTITAIRHPYYINNQNFWFEWRLTYEGGERYLDKYLQQFSSRETQEDFLVRKYVTPVPTFAKAAINDIRNSIYQRMVSVVRRDGSQAYQDAIEGFDGGVDYRGNGMDSFVGYDVLTELLIMGRVGVYVDMPTADGNSLADTVGLRPYLYMYPIEDILSWAVENPAKPSEFSAVLLRDSVVNWGTVYGGNLQMPVSLPDGAIDRYRFVFIDPDTRLVNVQFYNLGGDVIDPMSNQPTTAPPIQLNLTKIPFTMFDIGDSLLKDVSRHQRALLNLGSSDVSYALKANFTFWTEQRDGRDIGTHLKRGLGGDNTATEGGQGAATEERQIGVNSGIIYDKGMDRPGFISPSPDPLKASILLQEKLEDDIRKLVNLAVTNKSTKPVSAQAKDMDNQGLEAGLSFIGLELESGERKIANFWAAYEEAKTAKRSIAIVKYPDRYNLKSDKERIDEADQLIDLLFKIPGRTAKLEIAKLVIHALLGGRASPDILTQIERDIDAAPYAISEVDTIIKAVENGLCSDETGSLALGFLKGEAKKAQDDHTKRLLRIAEAQEEAKPDEDPGARGIGDMSANANAGKEEKEKSRDTTFNDSNKPPVRGEGK